VHELQAGRGFWLMGNQDMTSTGGAVIKREIDAGISGVWIRRADNGTPPLTSGDLEFRSAIASVPTKAHQGWDPREVWLRRIAQPRRSRAEDKS